MFDRVESQNPYDHVRKGGFTNPSIVNAGSGRVGSPKDTSPPYIYSPNYNNNYDRIARV